MKAVSKSHFLIWPHKETPKYFFCGVKEVPCRLAIFVVTGLSEVGGDSRLGFKYCKTEQRTGFN